MWSQLTRLLRANVLACTIGTMALAGGAAAQTSDAAPSPAVQELRRHVLDGDVNTLTFHNMDQIFDTRRVAHSGQPRPFVRSDAALPNYTFDGQSLTPEQFLGRTYTNAFLVIRDGRIVYERYLNRTNENTRFISFSMAKSITSLLIGIAVDKGYIRSIDQRATDYAPEFKGSGYDGVTIRQLLEMRSGADYEERYDFGATPSLAAQIFEKSLVENKVRWASFGQSVKRRWAPGSYFNYSTLDTTVLGLVLTRAVGQPIATFMQTNLWEPAGMEADGFWLLDGPPTEGRETNGMGFNATLRDYGRIGQLVLDQGRVGDRQIVSRDWIQKSTTPKLFGHPTDDAWANGYGFQWWFPKDAAAFSAVGLQGQFIYIDPPSRTVVVKLSYFPPNDPREEKLFEETMAFSKAIAATRF